MSHHWLAAINQRGPRRFQPPAAEPGPGPGPGGSYPALPYTLPNGLTHSTVDDTISGTLTDGVTVLQQAMPSFAGATVVTVSTAGTAQNRGDALRAAVNAAARNTVIVVPVGFAYDCGYPGSPLLLPGKAGTQWIWIISSTVYAGTCVRSPGNRIRLADVSLANFPQITGGYNQSVIATADGDATAGHYWLSGLWIVPGYADISDFCVKLGHGSAGIQPSISVTPGHFGVDRCCIEPASNFNGGQGAIGANGTHITIRDNRLAGWWSRSKTDPNAVGACNGPGPLLIKNNYLEGAGENVMLGGQNDPATLAQLISDVFITENHIYKRPQWNKNDGSYYGSGVGQPFEGLTDGPTVKTLVETKGSRRVAVVNNVFENSWASGQNGTAIQMYSVNQNNGSPFIVCRDWHIRYNKFIRVKDWFSIAALGEHPVAEKLQRVQFAQNLIEDLNDPWCGAFTFSEICKMVPDVRTGNLTAAPDHIQILHNTLVYKTANRGSTDSFLMVFWAEKIADAPGGATAWTNLVVKDNVLGNGNYGIYSNDSGNQGQLGLDTHCTSAVFINNAVLAQTDLSGNHPVGNTYITTANFGTHFTNAAADNWTLVGGSPLVAGASDGFDVGVNHVNLAARIAGLTA